MTQELPGIFPMLRTMYRFARLDQVAGGQPPRTTITERLTDCFCDLVELIRPELIVEVGAYEAGFAVRMKRRLPDAEVIAFEANPNVFNVFKDAARIERSGIHYVWRAISDRSGKVELLIPTCIGGMAKPLYNTMASLNHLTIPNSESVGVPVPAETLDGYIGTEPRTSVALWIDAEGAVDRVIAGGETTLGRSSAVLCEVENGAIWQGQATDQEILRCLAGYDLVPVLCDCARKFQYNVLLLKKELLDNPLVDARVRSFPMEIVSLLEDLN